MAKADSDNEKRRKRIAAKYRRRMMKARSRAGTSLMTENGHAASKKQKWSEFEELEPRPEPIVVR